MTESALYVPHPPPVPLCKTNRAKQSTQNKSGDFHLRPCHCLRYYMEILYGGFRGFSLLQLHITAQLCRNGDTCENRACRFMTLCLHKPPSVIFQSYRELLHECCAVNSLPRGCQLRVCLRISGMTREAFHVLRERFHHIVINSRSYS